MEIARCVGQVERGALPARLEDFRSGGLAKERGGLPYGQYSPDTKGGLSGALEGGLLQTGCPKAACFTSDWFAYLPWSITLIGLDLISIRLG
jgi:hypothetical protein